MRHNLEEDNIIAKTGSDGETSFEAVPEDVARQLDGTVQTDVKGNKTSVKDTGRKTMGEADNPGKKTLNQQDLLNLAKDLDVCTKEALRATGNEVAYTQQFFNKATNSIIIKAYFQQNADNPGKPEGQEFSYKLAEGKVMLATNGGKTMTNIAAIQTQSGTANLNRDIATDSIKKVISREEADATGEAGSSEPVKDVEDKPMLEEFSKAVDNYRANKSKDTIKELFRAARNFPGDDIQHKFANAVQAYRGIEPQTCSPSDPRCEEEPCEECDDCDISMTESLFIRLLEFAKEDAKDDVDIHQVAENVSRICNEKGCADIDDYDAIMSSFEQEHPGADDGEQPERVMSEEVEADNIIPKLDPNKTYTFNYKHYLSNTGEAGSGAGSGRDLIEWLEYLDEKGRNFKCEVHGSTVYIWVVGERPLTESEPDEYGPWDDEDPIKTPGDVTFYYEPETKKVYDEYNVPLEHGKKLVTGTISCTNTDVEDQSFSHEFGTEYIYVPICTEVDIEIEGISDDEDFYDEEEDIATAKSMLTKEDYENIREWGIQYMTERME